MTMETKWLILSAILTVIAYLLGSIPSSLWVGKLFYHTDVRDAGSGNAGATNTIRVLGWKAGLPVFLLDILKGWLALQLVQIYPEGTLPQTTLHTMQLILAMAAVTGHIFPIFAGFRGGKGVATTVGVGFAVFPIPTLIVFGIFILTLLITRYVSISSLVGGISFPILVLVFFQPLTTPQLILSLLVALFIPLTHISNIRRLLKGEESKFLGKKKKEENDDDK